MPNKSVYSDVNTVQNFRINGIFTGKIIKNRYANVLKLKLPRYHSKHSVVEALLHHIALCYF